MIGSQKFHIQLGLPIYAVVLVLVTVTSILSPAFLTLRNLCNVADRIAPLAVTALAQTVCIISGGIDLSLGATVSLATVILSFTGSNQPLSLAVGLLLCLLMGVTVGACNGLGIAYFRLPPLIMSLATSAVLQGISLYFRAVPGGEVNRSLCQAMGERIWFIPVSFLVTVTLYVTVWLMLSRTKLGRSCYAVGGHPENARKCGINPGLTRVRAQIITSLIGSMAGIMLAARVYTGDAVIGMPLGMDSVAAAIVGGTAITGGIGGPVGTFAGAMLMSMMSNLLNLLNVFVYYQYILRGLILCGALVFYQLRTAKRVSEPRRIRKTRGEASGV